MKLVTVQNKDRLGVLAQPSLSPLGERAGVRGMVHRGNFAVARRSRSNSAFTLAETLAALVFMAIVIPVAVEALHVASGAGEITVRKSEAARVADRILNESLVMTNWTSGSQSGTAGEGADDFHWTLTSQNWPQDAMELLTAEVTFSTQGRQYSVEMSTLANLQTQTTPAGAAPP